MTSGWLQMLNFLWIAVNVYVGLSSEQETVTARYIGVSKLIREILIEIALFHGTSRPVKSTKLD